MAIKLKMKADMKRDWPIGTKSEYIKKQSFDKDKVKLICSSYYKGTKRGYHENDIGMDLYKDGAVLLWNQSMSSDKSIYLYPEQVQHLRKFLRR